MRLRSLTVGLLIASLAVCPLSAAVMVESLFFGRASIGLSEQLNLAEQRSSEPEIEQPRAGGTQADFARSRLSRLSSQAALPVRSVSAADLLVPPSPRRLAPTIAPLPLPGRRWDPAPSARGPPSV